MQLRVNAADKVPLRKIMFKRCRRLLQMVRDLAKSSGWRVELQLSSNFTMNYAPLQTEALTCRYSKILYWNFLPEPGLSKCPWAWAWVAVKIISILYHVFALNIKIHLLEMSVSFLQTDGSWLKTMPRILTAAHMKHQSKKHQAVSQTSLSHSMCQAFRFMPWAATRCAEHLHFKMLGRSWRVGATWNTEMLRSISSSWTNTWPTLWWSIPICDMPHPLGHV